MQQPVAEVALRVVAGLLEGADARAEAMNVLRMAMADMFAQLDPEEERDSSGAWWRMTALDRLGFAYDQLVAVEAEALIVVEGLHRNLGSGNDGYREAYARLVKCAADRGPYLRLVRLGVRRLSEGPLRGQLDETVLVNLRLAVLAVENDDMQGKADLNRLGELLRMPRPLPKLRSTGSD